MRLRSFDGKPDLTSLFIGGLLLLIDLYVRYYMYVERTEYAAPKLLTKLYLNCLIRLRHFINNYFIGNNVLKFNKILVLSYF